MSAAGRLVAAVFNKSIANSTTDILATAITPSAREITAAVTAPSTEVGSLLVAYRITASIGTGVKLHLRYTDGSTTVDAPLNNDVALTADAVNTFTVELPRFARVGAGSGTITAMSFNFQLSAAATVNYLIVSEINSAVV